MISIHLCSELLTTTSIISTSLRPLSAAALIQWFYFLREVLTKQNRTEKTSPSPWQVPAVPLSNYPPLWLLWHLLDRYILWKFAQHVFLIFMMMTPYVRWGVFFCSSSTIFTSSLVCSKSIALICTKFYTGQALLCNRDQYCRRTFGHWNSNDMGWEKGGEKGWEKGWNWWDAWVKSWLD